MLRIVLIYPKRLFVSCKSIWSASCPRLIGYLCLTTFCQALWSRNFKSADLLNRKCHINYCIRKQIPSKNNKENRAYEKYFCKINGGVFLLSLFDNLCQQLWHTCPFNYTLFKHCNQHKSFYRHKTKQKFTELQTVK